MRSPRRGPPAALPQEDDLITTTYARAVSVPADTRREMGNAAPARAAGSWVARLCIIAAFLFTTVGGASVNSRGVVVPDQDARLDAWILGRFFAQSVNATRPRGMRNGPRPNGTAIREAVLAGLNRGFLRNDTSDSAIDLSRVDQGIVSFKSARGRNGAQVRPTPFPSLLLRNLRVTCTTNRRETQTRTRRPGSISTVASLRASPRRPRW